MVVDTGTIRLVIFLGMFLVFAGDYSTFLASIFGNAQQTAKNSSLQGPEGPPRNGPRAIDSLDLLGEEREEEVDNETRKAKMMATIKNACLPKLICELTSSPYQDQLSEMERSLLSLIRDTSLSMMAELPSRYHFGAHMGQLIAGIEGQGCHNFFPTCPLPRSSVLNMMKKIRMR
ncbi:uncharacterized protein geko isoform X2 [Venturia canescens]|uniref:uncharacterized protein geko isoform X2 n=1 Tax=Venturia canescens TaxID=32260 RepID=UPI001C9CA0E3|nr:uncharacterized protein LOC122414773 isoform X2 [Venturia canescens]